MSTLDPAQNTGLPAGGDGAASTSSADGSTDRAATVWAFSNFYRKTITPLTAYLIVSGAPAAIAAEIAQDCMIELFRRWETVHHPRSYAYRVGGRMWARRMTNARMETLVAELPEPTSLVPIPDALVELEARHEMLRILKTLPPRQRQVLFLTLQSFTPMEIAEQLELEPATIRAHLMRARRAAAAQLKEGEKEQ